jgi:hypothetical protein
VNKAHFNPRAEILGAGALLLVLKGLIGLHYSEKRPGEISAGKPL